MSEKESGKGTGSSLNDDIKISYAEDKPASEPIASVKSVPRRNNIAVTVAVIIAAVVVITVIAAVFLLGGADGRPYDSDTVPVDMTDAPDTTEAVQTGDTTAPTVDNSVGLSIISVTESGDKVLVETNLATVAFPYAFSDVISAEAINDPSGSYLVFTADCGEESAEIYSLVFNGNEGYNVGSLDVNGRNIAVSVLFYDSDLSGDASVTFKATQETFNDIAESLKSVSGYTPAG